MTFDFQLSTFLCLFVVLIWKAGTETQRASGSHAEEQEQKFNIVFGNMSLNSTLPPFVSPKEPSADDGTTQSTRDLAEPRSNTADYDELREDVHPNDASPENSVDRETSAKDGALFKEGAKTESASDVEEELSTKSNVEETAVPLPATSEGDSNAFMHLSCGVGGVECEATPHLKTDDVVSSSFEDKVLLSSTTVTPLWSIFKPTQPEATQPTSVSEVSTERPTTAQTSDNLIPVEGSAINKLDPMNEGNKTEKSKATKQTDPGRTIVKISSTTPLSSMTKGDISERDSTSATLISRMVEAASLSTFLPVESTYVYSDSSSQKDSPHPLSDYDSVEKDVTTPIPDMSTDLNSSELHVSSSVPYENETISTPHLLPSFRETTLYTTTTPGKETSTHFTTASTLNSRFVGKDAVPNDTEERVPPPRLTNPACSSLPTCIEISLLDTSWSEFCPQTRDFQEYVSKAVSHYIHPIHPHQVILEGEQCVPGHASTDVTVALYITDDSGEYAEKLTEICALILRKWGPTTFRNSVLQVRMVSPELQATPIPELTSGFVAAVSISAVAGVALCMLCILLVVMKQKLLQSRTSGTTPPSADAYSLDSLSINASFRRRRNRKSARSYLNHAFSDQEIPSHPLNEKSLQNCLKNREYLEEEFKKIPMNMPKLSDIPEGAHVKNRYSNILPKAESRVVLAEPSGDPFKSYINANYVKGHAGKNSAYIACQAPLPEGVEDFWRMVWEQQCRVVVMLTMFEENGISRCATYFPQSTLVAHPPYGDFQVSLVKKDVYEFYTMSTLRLLDLEKNLFRDVVHLWYTSWPDVGVPKDPSSLITFILQCRSYTNCNAGPTVVHCSTGTGRTGVYLALDLCMREYDESRSIDILQCIWQLRRDRGGAVQNKDQYILIHEAMLEYISRMTNHSERSSVQSE